MITCSIKTVRSRARLTTHPKITTTRSSLMKKTSKKYLWYIKQIKIEGLVGMIYLFVYLYMYTYHDYGRDRIVHKSSREVTFTC